MFSEIGVLCLRQKYTSLEKTDSHNYWIIFIGILIVGSTLRAPLTSVGPLISFIRTDLQISHTVAGLITTLPLLAFALLSPLAPKISRRYGMELTIFFSLLILLVGIILRSLFGVTFLFIGTILIGLAIAFGNVLMPVAVQLNFPFRVGVVMGFYAVFMNIFGAIASGISVPITTIPNFSWRTSLAFWAVLVLVAILLWLPQLRRKGEKNNIKKTRMEKSISLWRSPLAWQITIFMGLQSLMFYTLITWLPDILADHGYSQGAAGWMLFLMQVFIIPITFITPVIAEKMESQSLLGGLIGGSFLVGVLGLMLGNSLIITISIPLLGIAGGAAFSLCMMLFSLRTNTGEEAAEMSGMAQSAGYLLAAVGPTLFGALHDLTGNWKVLLIMLIVLVCFIFISAVTYGRNRKIEVKY